MNYEDEVRNFVEDIFIDDCAIEEAILLDYEKFKAAKTAMSIEFLLDETLYHDFAAYYPEKRMKVICLLRQYESFKIEKLVAQN